MNIRRWLSRRLMDTVNPEVNAAFGGEIALVSARTHPFMRSTQ